MKSFCFLAGFNILHHTSNIYRQQVWGVAWKQVKEEKPIHVVAKS